MPDGVDVPGGAEMPGGAEIPGMALIPGGGPTTSGGATACGAVIPGGGGMPGGGDIPGGGAIPGEALVSEGAEMAAWCTTGGDRGATSAEPDPRSDSRTEETGDWGGNGSFCFTSFTSASVGGFGGSFATPNGVDGRDNDACEDVFVDDGTVVAEAALRSRPVDVRDSPAPFRVDLELAPARRVCRCAIDTLTEWLLLLFKAGGGAGAEGGVGVAGLLPHAAVRGRPSKMHIYN